MLNLVSRPTLLVGLSFVSIFAMNSLGAVVVTPNGNAAALGNGQSTNPLRNYGTGGSRYRQVYDASLFGALDATEAITGLAFRAKQAPFLTFIGNTVNVSDVVIRLSTTAKNDVVGLDATFANNVGPDATVVYSGPLTLTTAAGGTTAIDYSIALQNAFNYTKSMGNLLLDVTIPDTATVSGNGSIGFAQFDTVTDAFPSADGISSAFGATGSGTIGANSTTGVVTQFVTRAVPEPTAACAIVAGGLVAARRRRAGR